MANTQIRKINRIQHQLCKRNNYLNTVSWIRCERVYGKDSRVEDMLLNSRLSWICEKHFNIRQTDRQLHRIRTKNKQYEIKLGVVYI